MKLTSVVASLCVLASTAHAAAIPDTFALSIRSTLNELSLPFTNPLEKRKGGGGRAGGSSSSGSSSSGSSSSGSSSSGSSGSSSGSSGSSSGSSGSTSSGSRGSSGLGSTGSNTGGRTTSGSGVRPAYGAGGTRYAGGAVSPYRSGSRSPLGISPVFLAAPALAFGGLWLYGAYAYPYNHPYNYHNATNGTNSSLPVNCLCEQYQECGCDDDGNDTSTLDQLTNNGTNFNSTMARIGDYQGKQTLLLNGTLENGTTAAGGTDDATTSSAFSVKSQGLAGLSGWWMMLATVSCIILTV